MMPDYTISLSNSDTLHCRFWDDEGVVFNSLSGETHLLDGVGAAILKKISANPIPQKALLAYIQSIFEFEHGTHIEKLLDSIILEYQKLGLIASRENPAA